MDFDFEGILKMVRLSRDTTHSIVFILVKCFQTKLMVEIYSKSLVGAISKVLLIIVVRTRTNQSL